MSKLFWWVAAPITALLLVATLGALLLITGPVRIGRRLVLIGVGALLACGTLPLGTLLLTPLENRFPPLPDRTPAPAGILVLGGSTDQDLALARHRVTIANAAERLTEAVTLARRFPDARLVFTGGSAALTGSRDSEAADARRLWVDLGIPDSRITTEDRSRNTDENVRFTKALVEPKPGERWVLVTSAFHMPRAVALFRANGWDVTPDPVDYRTTGATELRPSLDLGGNWMRLDVALHEWVGLMAYRATGRTTSVLPAP